MTVTSVPAQVAPSAPTPHDGSNAPDAKSSAPDDGFASVLAGAHDQAHGSRAEPKSGAAHRSEAKPTREPVSHTQADTNTPTGATSGTTTGAEAPAETEPESATPDDPVTLALVAALAGTAPRDARPDSITTPPPAVVAETAPVAPATPDLALSAAAPAALDATTAASAEAAVATADLAPTTVLPDPAAVATDTAPGTEPSEPDEPKAQTAAPTAPKPAAPPTTGATAPAPTPAPSAATANALAAAATVAAVSAPAPEFRAEPAPKPDAVQDNAMITAATTALDRAPRAESIAAAAPAAPAAPADPPPAAQIAAVIRPMQRGPEGTYQVRIEMRPPELGRVDMRVEIRDGVIHAAIHTEHAQTAELVRAALDDLRARLDADGMQSGQFTVDAQGAGTSGRDSQAATPEHLDDPLLANAPEPTVVVAPTTTSDSLLDVRI